VITAATFTASLLKNDGDTHHRCFVLLTVGENLGSYHRRLVTQTRGDKPIIIVGLCYQPIVMVDPFVLPVCGTNRW
jgi:hypothetical protein